MLRPLIVDYGTANILSLDESRRSPGIGFGAGIRRHSNEITTSSFRSALSKDIGHGWPMPLERMVIQQTLNNFQEIVNPAGGNAGSPNTGIRLEQLQQYRAAPRKQGHIIECNPAFQEGGK